MMGRRPDPSIRVELRARAVEYVLERGFADLSLRPLADALGTNARMLVYHFGSREGLMREILIGLREREGAVIAAWFRARRPTTMTGFLRWYWKRISTPAALPAARIIFELYALALRDREGYPGVIEDPLAFWKGLLREAGFRSAKKREVLATLILATTRGLLLDVTSTRDVTRTSRALAKFACGLERNPKPRRGSRERIVTGTMRSPIVSRG